MRLFHPTAWIVAVLSCGCLALLSDTTWARCPTALPSPPQVDTHGWVLVGWNHAGCQPDTLRASSGTFANGFRPANGYPVQAIAIKLGSIAPGTIVGGVRAYFRGVPGILAAEWRDKADFAWSLHSDSMGYPSAGASHTRLVPLGDDALLRAGGWREDQLTWTVEASGVADYWLVGLWPPLAVDVVQIGSDGMTASCSELAGVGTTEIEYWQALPQPGLLIEVELQDGFGDVEPDVAIVRDRGANPLTREPSLPEILGYCLGHFTDSLVAWPEVVRYGLVSICETVESDTSWSAPVAMSRLWDVSAAPDSLACTLSPTAVGTYSVILNNPSAEPLNVSVLEAYLAPAGVGSPPTVFAGPPSQNLPADGSAEIPFEIKSLATPVGMYRGAVILRVASIPDTAGFQLGIPVQVIIDQQTSVTDPDDDEGRINPSDWRLAAGPNPFEESINLHFAWDEGLILGGRRTSIGSVGQVATTAEVAVYNVLGQLILQERHLLEPIMVAQAGEARIQITGTNAWPTGVYVCRANLAGRAQSITLLHIK